MSINIEDFNKVNCPFTIKWSRGAEIRRSPDSIECTLRPGDRVFFVLEFKPRKRGSFSAEAPIYVRGELDDGIFNKLRLDGEFPASSIDVVPTEIYLTPVPLGTAIEEKFRIRAKHFDNTTFIRPNFLTTTQRCSGDYKDELLRVEFLNGNAISPQSYVELEARITFKSDQPISFCLTIEFSDDHALAVCFLTVYATADNNLLTTYMHPTKSSFDKKYMGYLKNVSCPLELSDSTTDEDDYNSEVIPNVDGSTRKHNELFESGLSVTSPLNSWSRSFVDSKYWIKKINDNGIDNKNIQVDGNPDDKQVPICNKYSPLKYKSYKSIDFKIIDPKYSKSFLRFNSDDNQNE